MKRGLGVRGLSARAQRRSFLEGRGSGWYGSGILLEFIYTSAAVLYSLAYVRVK